MNLTDQPTPESPSLLGRLPRRPIEQLMAPLRHFLHVEAAGGVVLLLCTVAALVLTNSPLSAQFIGFWKSRVGLVVGSFTFEDTLGHWINDGLMTVFFFVVGLEIKRELVAGELRDPRNAALPVVAAVGGMVVPAGIYLALRAGRPGEEGWAIPMATDIAFVVGLLGLLGPRVPNGLKILLLSLAIADDIGAILVIALFFSAGVSFPALALAALGLVGVVLLRRLGVRWVPVYVVVGLGIWLAFLKSGIHPTIAGVLLGLLTPARPWLGTRTFRGVLADAQRELPEDGDPELAHHVVQVARESVSPLQRLEDRLHPWVAFGIMPLFALANAGVVLDPVALAHPVALATALGLILGKPLGILLFSWVAVRLGLGRLPEGVNWKALLGGGFLAGIGFTMSLFIAGLALEGPLLEAGKIGTLLGTAVSAVSGFLLCLTFLGGRNGEARQAAPAVLDQGPIPSEARTV